MYYIQRSLLLLIFMVSMAMATDTTKDQESSEGTKKAEQMMKKLMRKPTEAEQESMQLYGEWTQQLIEFLLNHEQPYVQAIGLNHANSIIQAQNELSSTDIFHQSQAQVINELVENQTLNFETLKILENLCFQKELDTYCNREALLDKLIQLYPHELSVYLRPLQLAMESGNEGLTENLMQVMSGTQQYTLVDYLLPEFVTLIQNYIEENPIPEAALLRNKNDYLTTMDLTQKQKAILEKNISKIMPFTVLMSMQLALPFPNLKPLKDICQVEPAYSSDCLYIAKTMLHQSNSILTKAMGHVINLGVYELNNQQDMLIATQANHARFKGYAQCLSQAINNNKHFEDMFDKRYFEIWLTDQDELTRLAQTATYLYKKRQSEDDKETTDPAECR